MSAPRILFAPTHSTRLASAVASALAEVLGRQRRHVRYHQLGVTSPVSVWDRWEGSSFLDPSLYGNETMSLLYDNAIRGADLSLLASDRGIFDAGEGVSWTPESIARILDCPTILVVDCRGWGSGIVAVVEGFRSRAPGLAGIVLTGVEDRAHREVLRRALAPLGLPVCGCLYQGDGPGWDDPAPGAWNVPIGLDLVEAVHRQVDAKAVEELAHQRGFLPGSSLPSTGDSRAEGPLILVAGGRGFTPWSRDSIELLRGEGARIERLDLAVDAELPPETAGVVLAGHLWVEALPELAENYRLMRELRVRVAEGLPMLAFGGGMLYLLKRIQDDRGRTFDLAGLLPAEGEIVGEFEDPAYLEVQAQRETLVFEEGERFRGWVSTDAEIITSPAGRNFPFLVTAAGWAAPQAEGAAARNLLSSRILVHLASAPRSARRFVAACGRYAEA